MKTREIIFELQDFEETQGSYDTIGIYSTDEEEIAVGYPIDVKTKLEGDTLKVVILLSKNEVNSSKFNDNLAEIIYNACKGKNMSCMFKIGFLSGRKVVDRTGAPIKSFSHVEEISNDANDCNFTLS